MCFSVGCVGCAGVRMGAGLDGGETPYLCNIRRKQRRW